MRTAGRPAPFGRIRREFRCHRIIVNVFQFLPEIPYGPNDVVEISALPQRDQSFRGTERSLAETCV